MNPSIQIGDHVGISLGGVYHAAAGRILTRACMAEVVEASEKAVKLEAMTDRGTKVSAWFPRKALVPEKTSAAPDGTFAHGNHLLHCVKLAPWFRAEGWTNTFLSIAGAC